VSLLEGRLFVELAMAEDGWWWRNGMIGSRPELGQGCFDMSVMEIVKGKMQSIASGVESTALCGCLHWALVVTKAEPGLDPYSF
jgi:hypothetical protein